MIDNSQKKALLFGVRNDSSIVWAVALKLQASGCEVALAVAPENYDTVKTLVGEKGMLVFACDIRKDKEVQGVFDQLQTAWRQLDYLLHGVAYGNHKVMCSSPPGSKEEAPDFLDIPFEDFIDSFDISAFSLIRVCRAAKPLLTENASILTLTYNASQKVFPGYAGMAINKAALENMVKYLAWYFGETGIRVNAISAGLVMTTSAGGIKGVRKLRKLTRLSAPLGNIKADEVANATLYYFSELSKGNTGNLHYVDGGLNVMGVATDSNG